MAQGDGGVGVKEHLGNREAHNVAAANYNGPLALGIYAYGSKQLHDAGGRAGRYVRGFLPQPGNVVRMEPVNVFLPGYGLYDLGFRDVTGERKLHQDAVHGIVRIQRLNQVKQLFFRCAFRKHYCGILYSNGLAGLFLVAYVHYAGGVFANADNYKVRSPSILFRKLCNALSYAFFECRGNGFTVNYHHLFRSVAVLTVPSWQTNTAT